MKSELRKQELCDIAKIAYLKGMVCGSGGNISFKENDCIYITPSGYMLDNLAPSDLICVDMEGHYEGYIKPSVETLLHLKAYKVREDILAIVHLHPYYSILVGIKEESEVIMPAYTGFYACKVKNIKMIPFYKSGDPVFIQKISKCLNNFSALLLRNHGIFAVGENLREAFAICEYVEFNAKMHITLHGKGALTKEQIAILKEK